MPKRPTLSRRTFLQASGALALGACAPPSTGGNVKTDPQRPVTDPDAFDNAQTVDLDVEVVPQDDVRFPLSVQAGAMTARGVSFWGFVADGSAATLKVWRPGPEPGKVRQVHSSEATPNSGGYLKVRVEGLAPDTLYSYAWFGQDARSAVGRVRTAFPEGMLWPITLAATTCTNFRFQPYKALSMGAEEDVDLLIHVGDMSYNDGAETLEEYRERWQRTLADPGYLALLKRQGSYVVWDDHEFENNLDPEAISPAKLTAAKGSFYEALPMEPGPTGALWQSFRWGNTAEVIVLDCRTERIPSTLGTGDQVYMSAEQRAFLKQTLKDSPCHFKIVLNSVPMTKFPDTFWANKGDRWQGYTTSRDEILNHLETEAIDNVWFISGDLHTGFVCRLEQEGFRRTLFDVAVGPGGMQGNPLSGLAEMDPQLREEIFPSDQFFYFGDNLAMTYLTLDPLRDVVRIRFVDAETRETLFDRELSRNT